MPAWWRGGAAHTACVTPLLLRVVVSLQAPQTREEVESCFRRLLGQRMREYEPPPHVPRSFSPLVRSHVISARTARDWSARCDAGTTAASAALWSSSSNGSARIWRRS
eukprot:COSAG01_NODE_7416_length_3217_cov_1.389994_4_plen_108_part_00